MKNYATDYIVVVVFNGCIVVSFPRNEVVCPSSRKKWSSSLKMIAVYLAFTCWQVLNLLALKNFIMSLVLLI